MKADLMADWTELKRAVMKGVMKADLMADWTELKKAGMKVVMMDI